MPKSPAEMQAAILRNLPEKTGRSLTEWKKLAKPHAPRASKKDPILSDRDKRVLALRDALKIEHELGGVTAHCIAWEVLRPADHVEASEADLLDAQFAGPKGELRPVYDKLVTKFTALGDDVTVTARKTQITVSRKNIFAIVKVATRSRIDLGLRLPQYANKDLADGAIEAGDHFSGNTTHRVRLEDPADINGTLVRHIRAAYQARG